MNKEKYEQAKANTLEIAKVCFGMGRHHERALNNAFANEAVAARTYIAELNGALEWALGYVVAIQGQYEHVTDSLITNDIREQLPRVRALLGDGK